MGPRAVTAGVEGPERACLFGGELAVRGGEFGEDGRVGEVAVAGVEVVVATHRLRGELHGGLMREPFPDRAADVTPQDWMCELRFDPPCAAVDADQCLVEHPHVGRIVARAPAVAGLGNQVGELV